MTEREREREREREGERGRERERERGRGKERERERKGEGGREREREREGESERYVSGLLKVFLMSHPDLRRPCTPARSKTSCRFLLTQPIVTMPPN